MTNTYTGLESALAAQSGPKVVPASVTAFLAKVQAAKDTRNKAINFTPAFAEYNADVRKAKREEALAKIDNRFVDEIASVYDSTQIRIKSLQVDVRRKKYPLLSTATLVDMWGRILGATEYNSAIQLVDLAEDRFPIEEMWDAYSSNRIDLCSALIDITSRRNTPPNNVTDVDWLKQRVEFSKEINRIYKLLGVHDLLIEQLELGKVLTQIVYEYEVAINNPARPLLAAVDKTLTDLKSDQQIFLMTA